MVTSARVSWRSRLADFETFYARTQPWIAEAAVSEYGHPVTDRDLLRALSPLRAFDSTRPNR
ncbi:hypothetical protein [Herbidospora cretacea]|uniref:hypothetical protein n=1 Tax=Herbidospora cretacea TaxID=28444 RepID=UPI000773E12D|nr:hypothetical protein [Herbidospora cretacea]